MNMKSRLLLLILMVLGVARIAEAQAVVQLAPDPKYQFLDASGNPLPGGKLCTYVTGTNTAQATYTDHTGMTQNANPTILDAGGRANVWWDVTKIYRAVLRAAGTTTTCNDGAIQWTVDGIQPANAESLLTSSNRWTGNNVWCGPRPWRDVMCYGAIGDGSADDGPAIQAAINDAIVTGGTVHFSTPPIDYFIATTVTAGPTCPDTSALYLLGEPGPRAGGYSQFARAPRVHINGTAIPLFDFGSTCDDTKFTLENLDILSQGGMGVRFTDNNQFILLKNVGVANFFDSGVTNSAALLLSGSTLWFKAEDSDFGTLNHNTGPFNPAPGKDYDPTSWTPASVLIYCNSTIGGSILFIFDNVTYAFGGVKLVAADGLPNGSTLGEMIFNMNAIEGQFASPLLQFENQLTGAPPIDGATLGRVTVTESQAADVAHPTPLISVLGIDGSHTASIGAIFFMHSLSHSDCYVQGINGNENISGIWSDSPQNTAFACDENSLPVGDLVRHSNTGLEFTAPLSGPTGPRIGTGNTGAIRTFVPDGVHAGDLTASSMIDTDGSFYFGAGGTSPFDLMLQRSGTKEYSINIGVPAPTMMNMTAAAGGGFLDGTYYACVASGDRNNPPFTVSACGVEDSVVLGGGNNTIDFTWVDEPTNISGLYTIYIGTAAGAENKAANVGGTPQTLVAMPGSNQVPNATGTLLAPVFSFIGNGSTEPNGLEFTTVSGFGNGAAATPVTTTAIGTGSGPAVPETIVKYLKITLGGVDYWVPLAQ